MARLTVTWLDGLLNDAPVLARRHRFGSLRHVNDDV
jgi:hypothetical protein